MVDAEDDKEDERNPILDSDIFEFYTKNRHLSFAEIVELYKEKFHEATEEPGPSFLTIYKRLKDVYEKVTKKLRGAKKTEFLSKEFSKPIIKSDYISTVKKDTPRKRALRRELLESKRETKQARKTLFEMDQHATESQNEYDALLERY